MREYKIAYGNGHMTLDLDGLMPTSAHNMGVIIDMIKNSPDMEEKADELHRYIVEVVNDLQARREKINAVQEKAKITARIKTFLANNDLLVKHFGVESIADSEVVRTKKAEVFACQFNRNTGKAEIKVYTGKKFQKYGMEFTAYKAGKGHYIVLLPSTGFQVTYGNTLNAAIANITENVVDTIKNSIDSEKLHSIRRLFETAMQEAGFGNELETIPELAPLAPVENQAETVETAEPAAVEPEKAAETAETAEAVETVEEFPVENTPQMEKPVEIALDGGAVKIPISQVIGGILYLRRWLSELPYWDTS